MSKLQIGEGHVEEIKGLIKTGDVKLEEYRAKFISIVSRNCNLTDENLIRAIAATEDDDDQEFVENALLAETEQAEAAAEDKQPSAA